MGQWVITVAGIAILSVICDVILPEGQTRKYVKTVFGIIVTLVMIQPIIGFFSGELNVDVSDKTSIEAQEHYLQNIQNKKNIIAIENVKRVADENGYKVKDISLSTISKSLKIKVDCVYNKKSEETLTTIVAIYFPDYKLILTSKLCR